MQTEQTTQFSLPFSSDDQLAGIAREVGTPLYVYDEASLRKYAAEALSAPNAFGLNVRYAMKANPHRAILRIFEGMGLEIDASSYYEVKRAMAAGIKPGKIQLTSQDIPSADQLKELVQLGVIYNATSLLQLKMYGELFAGHAAPLSVRINPGLGSGHNNRTNTGGPAASFGIWRDYIPQVQELAKKSGLKITRLHSHVGSGSDWKTWQKAAELSLEVVLDFPDVQTLNLGGGFKIDRMDPSKSIRFAEAFIPVKEAFEKFAQQTGRKLKLEIEPGTFLAANSCVVVAKAVDVVDTGQQGYRFIKLDASMTELLRPMIYGARHPIRLLGKGDIATTDYVVVGTCCESGDIFTPKAGNPEELDSAKLPEVANGDIVAIMGSGAYGAAMCSRNYNSHLGAPEVMIGVDGKYRVITRREEMQEIWRREME